MHALQQDLPQVSGEVWMTGMQTAHQIDVAVGTSVPAGEYELVAGMYLLGTGERLPVLDDNGQTLGDTVSLGEVTVAER